MKYTKIRKFLPSLGCFALSFAEAEYCNYDEIGVREEGTTAEWVFSTQPPFQIVAVAMQLLATGTAPSVRVTLRLKFTNGLKWA